jgi:putative oxidoreductase
MFLDLGLLFLRVTAGGLMLFGHGLGKLMSYSGMVGTFPDPLGMGSRLTLIVAIFAEVLCAFLVMIGLSTRLATLPVIGTLVTAAFIVHAADPWAKQEFALVYAIPFMALFFTGPGKISVDGLLKLRGLRRP